MTNVLIYPDTKLSTPSVSISAFDSGLLNLIETLVNTMHSHGGLGLAAPQIGVNQRIFVMNANPLQNPDITPGAAKVFINPEITWYSPEKSVFTEGCLSAPGIFCLINRPSNIELCYQDENGNDVEEKFDGIFARIVQHEMEHLEGEFFFKHLSRLKRDIAIRKMKKVK